MKGIAVAMFVLSPASAWATLISSNLCHLAPPPPATEQPAPRKALVLRLLTPVVVLEDGPRACVQADVMVARPATP